MTLPAEPGADLQRPRARPAIARTACRNRKNCRRIIINCNPLELQMNFERGALLGYFSCNATGNFRCRLPRALSLVSTKRP
jgi:hypothetical protein